MEAIPTLGNGLQTQLAESRERRIASLADFRRETIKETPYETRKPYSARKKKALFYRVVFYHLALILFILSANVFLRQPHWILCDLYLGYCWMLKGIVGTFSGLLAAVSTMIAVHIRTETEAVFHLWQEAKKRLGRLYRSKLAGCGASLLSPFLGSDARLNHLRAAYLHRREDLIECRKKTETVLAQISGSSLLDAGEKEGLMNEALIEFEEELAYILFQYERQ